MTNFPAIHSQAKIMLTGAATEIAAHAMAGLYDTNGEEHHAGLVRDAVKDAREALDQIEAVLNAALSLQEEAA